MIDLKTQLTTLGMSDKEAQVYLTMLELGPASVQDIAKKAGVNRATTYVMLEGLKRRGLVSSVDRGKKTHFTAESPQHLMTQVKQEQSTVEDKLNQLQNVMPDFMALFNAVEDKPKVRFFEGLEGITAVREAMLDLLTEAEEPRVFINYDRHIIEVAKHQEGERLKFFTNSKSIRILYANSEGLSLPKFGTNVQLKRMPAGIASFIGEFNIFKKFVSIVIAQQRAIAVIIESEDAARLFQSFFDIAWIGSKQE